MSDGFFSASLVTGANPRKPTLPACGACKLLNSCSTPKIPTQGQGGKRVLIVLDQPTAYTDQTGDSFGGDGGDMLRRAFKTAGIDIEADCWITYATICRSGSKKESRATSAHVAHCSPHLAAEIKRLKPEVIVPMGPLAINSVVRLSWREKVEETERFQGYVIPSEKLNAWVCPMLSVSEINRIPEYKQDIPRMLLKKHLKAMAEKIGTVPHPDGVVNWADMVQVITDPDEAAAAIDKLPRRRGAAVDYEANGLKPEHLGMKLYSCAILIASKDSKRISKVIAYPMRGAAIEATKRWLADDSPKIIANMKYEQRWTVCKLELPIRNIIMDTMLAAHVCDNRKGTKGVKFLAYVLLGWEDYNSHIEPFLQKTANPAVNLHVNSIHEIDQRQLLKYNGLDDIAEWLIAEVLVRQIHGCELHELIDKNLNKTFGPV